MAKQNKPAIRFKGFTDAWEQRKLGEFFEKYQNTVYLQDEEEYRQISIRNTGVVEYRCTNKGKNIGRKRQYLIDTDTHPVTLTFTRQTVYEGGIGFVPKELNGAIVTENMPLLEMTNASQDFMKALFNTSGYYKSVINDDTLIGSAQKALHEKQWLDSYVCIPVLDEQKQIGSFFQQLEHLITLHQRKYDKLQVLKKAMLEKMFPKNGSSVPEIRFKGFTDAWEQRKLGEIAVFSKGVGYSKNDLCEEGTPIILYGRLYTKYETCIFDVDTFVKEKAGSVYSKGGEVIVPASGETAEDISIASVVVKPGILLGGDLNIVSPTAEYDSAFLALTISSGATHKYLSSLAQGKSVVHLHNSDIQSVSAKFPTKREQEKIHLIFGKIDTLITLHQRELEKLQNIKKSMLEKMFV